MILFNLEWKTMKTRCAWAGSDPLYVAYHDEQWGVPLHDDRELFEMLVLEGAQAGLSWSTILNKRENYRSAFDGFEIARVAAYGEAEVQRLLADPGIVRNRLKIHSAIRNARAVLEIQQEFGSLDAFLWQFVDGEPIQNAWKELRELPAQTPLAETMSKELKRCGLNFIGPTICYALMQSIGMVNDHVVDCFRYEEVKALGQL
jgi:DNA-3-methyladenine glycosylase I